MVAYVDPDPIGKDYAEKYNFFPTTNYSSLKDMLNNEKLDLLMVGSPNHLHLEHIKEGLESGLKIFAEKLERGDLQIAKSKSTNKVNRVIVTKHKKLIQKISNYMGFKSIPSVKKIIDETL